MHQFRLPITHLVSRRLSRREINFKADIQSTLKRTKNHTQSDLSDFVFEPGEQRVAGVPLVVATAGNLFQGGVDNGARYEFKGTLGR